MKVYFCSLLALIIQCMLCTEQALACIGSESARLSIHVSADTPGQEKIFITPAAVKCRKAARIVKSNGKKTLLLPQGVYLVRISAPQCKTVQRKIALKRNRTITEQLQCVGNIIPTPTPIISDSLYKTSKGSIERRSLEAYARSLTNEEILNAIDVETLANLLYDLKLTSSRSSIVSYLDSAGINHEALSLKSGGLITATASYCAAQSGYQQKFPRAYDDLLFSRNIEALILDSFREDPLTVLEHYSQEALSNLLYTSKSDSVRQSPVLLVANERIPFYLGGNSQQIVRRLAIGLDFESGQKSDAWEIPVLASTIKSIPAENRAFFVSFTAGSGAETLDQLRDRAGRVIEKFPGIPYRFPSYNQWGDRVKQNLTGYLEQIRSSFEQQRGIGAIAKYVAIDFESIWNDWETTALYFQGNHALLLEDPRVERLKEDLQLSNADLRSLDSWGIRDPRRLRWDRYMLSQRAKVLEYAVSETFRSVFGNASILSSNYDDALRSDRVPNGAFERKEFRIWGGIGTALNPSGLSLSSIPLYGLHYQRSSTPTGEILSTPPAPAVLHAVTPTEYYTRANTFVSTLNRMQSIYASTSSRTNPYVTFSEFIDEWHDGYYGPCVLYNIATKRYERKSCPDSEGMQGFMFEYWALAAQNAEYINLYTLSQNAMPLTEAHARKADQTMKEINRLLGFSDRQVSYDASVIVDGVPTGITGKPAEYNKPFYLWASKANNQRVIRVVFTAPNGFEKTSAIIRDGHAGDGVLLEYGGSQVEIPGARIDWESASDRNSPFGFFITQPLDIGKLL